MPSPEGKIPGSPEPREGKCGAKLRGHNKPEDERFGRYCDQVAGYGTSHVGHGACKFHGGSTPSSIVAAERVKVKQEATRLQQLLGTPATMQDPYVELWKLTAKVVQWMEIAELLMSELESADPVTDRAGIEHSKELIVQWERAVIMARDTLVQIAKLDLSKKLLQIKQDQADIIATAINAMITSPELNMTDDQVDLARLIFAKKIEPVKGALELNWLPSVEEVEIFEAEILGDDE